MPVLVVKLEEFELTHRPLYNIGRGRSKSIELKYNQLRTDLFQPLLKPPSV